MSEILLAAGYVLAALALALMLAMVLVAVAILLTMFEGIFLPPSLMRYMLAMAVMTGYMAIAPTIMETLKIHR